MYAIHNNNMRGNKPEKEAIHSGQFMVSHFEAEEPDDEDDVAVPIPEVNETKDIIEVRPSGRICNRMENQWLQVTQQPLAIDTSLSKLFQCMSIAYRQKLTSPKWNRFRGIRLRWKDKIRLNNVIWRCWHMQFIKKENTPICQFASPLEVDTHNKPEAVVLEGKYWKRKLEAVTAEYKKWRMFYRNQVLGHSKDVTDISSEIELFTGNSQSSENMHMMVDADYMDLMSDTLFSTITSHPFVFPDSREIARAGLADFIQPSLGPLQPNLDDYMDTFEPLHELITGKLATVPEENANNMSYYNYVDLDLIGNNNSNMEMNDIITQYNSVSSASITTSAPSNQVQDLNNSIVNYNNEIVQNVAAGIVSANYNETAKLYQNTVISKSMKDDKTRINKMNEIGPGLFRKSSSSDDIYQNYNMQNMSAIPQQQQQQQQPQQDITNFKIPLNNTNQAPQGYKFQTPSKPNIKFTSKKEEKATPRMQRGGRRSRSNTREPNKRPPLIATVSDPAIITTTNSLLLTQLLTNNSNDTGSLFNRPNTIVTQDPAPIIKEEVSQLPSLLAQRNNTTATLIITPDIINVQNPSADPLMNSQSIDQQNIHSPTSSQGSIGSPNRENCRDQRRVGHIHAEQKRRYNIKNGFDMLHSLIPHLNQNPNAKLSKAAMLQKGAEYIRQLRMERLQLTEEMENLKQEVERLNTSISNCQSLLPATGAPVSRRRDNKIQDMFDKYVRTRTLENWKFWIFSLLFRPLLMSFNNFVSTQSLEELYRSTLHWVEQHCTLVDLRPVVLNSLRYLCTQTDILSEPEKLPSEVKDAVLLNKHNQNN